MGAGQSEQKIREKLTDAKTVIVVGGSYTGIGVAKLLQNDFNVIVLERKNYHLHNIGALRACVDPGWAKNIVIPYERSLNMGQIVQAEVQEVTPTDIRVHGRQEPLKFDYCIIATGTSYAFPARVPTWKAEEVSPMYFEIAKAISSAKSILVVGGGPVGVELCGEIRDHYSPAQKKITLIQSQNYLIPGPAGYELSEKFRVRVLDKVKSKGVDVRLGERVQLDDDLKEGLAKMYYVSGERTVKTDKGSYECDLVFWAFGAKVNNQTYGEHFAASMESTGRLRVKNTMQVDGHSNVFAVGDCSVGGTRGEMMMLFVGLQTLPIVAENIKSLAAGKGLKDFKGPSPSGAMIVPVGKDGGVSNFPLPMGVRGDFTTRMLKSKDLMTDQAWKSQGFKGMGDASIVDVKSGDVDAGRLAHVLGIDEAGAAEMAKGLGAEDDFRADGPAVRPRAGTAAGQKLLVIASSPLGEHSVSNQVGQAFVEKYKIVFPQDEVETLDISSGQLLPFTAARVVAKFKNHGGEDVEAQQEWGETKLMIDKFKGADKVVFLLPTWNFHVPSDTKLYLDHIVQAHKTFDPNTFAGLVTGKPCLLVRASTGVAIGSDMDSGTAYMKQILAFIGFTDIRVLAATGFPEADMSRPWLEAVKQQAEELAAKFVFDADAKFEAPTAMQFGAAPVPEPAALPSGVKILHVSCSPMGEGSASLSAAEGFLEAAKAQVGASVIHLDLAQMSKDGTLLPYTASRVMAKFATFAAADATVPDGVAEDWQYTKDLIEQCKAVDVIVFSVPMWNLCLPYTLKRWMDHIAQPHKTFDPATYKGLLGKRGFVVAASGNGLLGSPLDHLTPYMMQFCGFVGIEPSFHAHINGSSGDQKAANVEAAVQALKAQACLT